MGAKSQRKGRAAELELTRILQGHGYPVEAGRAQSYGEVPDISSLSGVHVECKRVEALYSFGDRGNRGGCVWTWRTGSPSTAAENRQNPPREVVTSHRHTVTTAGRRERCFV